MKKVQRFKYEMFVRVRDFGAEHASLFPEGTIGGQAFARVLAAAPPPSPPPSPPSRRPARGSRS